MVSAFTGWLGKSPFPPGDTRQLWLSRGQGRERTRESCGKQLPCKAKEPPCLFSFVRAVTRYILLETLHCFRAVPPAQSRHASWRDRGTPCRPARGTVCQHIEPRWVPDIQAKAGARKCSRHLRLRRVGGPTPQRRLLLEIINSPSRCCLILALHLEAPHCRLPWLSLTAGAAAGFLAFGCLGNVSFFLLAPQGTTA